MLNVVQIYDLMSAFIKKSHPISGAVRMPYCKLTEEPITKERYYRVELHWRETGKYGDQTAIAEIDAEAGGVRMIKEGFTWKNWL